MQLLRQHSVSKILWIGMLSVLINISIDPKDILPVWVQENFSVNEIESLIELTLEDVLGFSDAIPEHEEADGDTNSFAGSIIYIKSSVGELANRVLSSTRTFYVMFDTSIYSMAKRDIIPPPPKA